MQTLQLFRTRHRQDGTFGTLLLPSGKQLLTGELPWRDNRTASSCIPPGTYRTAWAFSARFGWCYRLEGTGKRQGILIHPANYLGLAAEGFKQELQGCIALGLGVAHHGSQQILTSSRSAIGIFNTYLNRQPFSLEITNG